MWICLCGCRSDSTQQIDPTCVREQCRTVHAFNAVLPSECIGSVVRTLLQTVTGDDIELSRTVSSASCGMRPMGQNSALAKAPLLNSNPDLGHQIHQTVTAKDPHTHASSAGMQLPFSQHNHLSPPMLVVTFVFSTHNSACSVLDTLISSYFSFWFESIQELTVCSKYKQAEVSTTRWCSYLLVGGLKSEL